MERSRKRGYTGGGDEGYGKPLDLHDLEHCAGASAPMGHFRGRITSKDVSAIRGGPQAPLLIFHLECGLDYSLKVTVKGDFARELHPKLRIGMVVHVSTREALVVQEGHSMTLQYVKGIKIYEPRGSLTFDTWNYDAGQIPPASKRCKAGEQVPMEHIGRNAPPQTIETPTRHAHITCSSGQTSRTTLGNMLDLSEPSSLRYNKNRSQLTDSRDRQTVYRPLSSLQSGQCATFVGVVYSYRQPQVSSRAECDSQLTMNLLDTSNLERSGGASCLDAQEAGLLVTLFDVDEGWQNLRKGDVVLIDHGHVRTFKPQPEPKAINLKHVVCEKDSYSAYLFSHTSDAFIAKSGLAEDVSPGLEGFEKCLTLALWWARVKRTDETVTVQCELAQGKESRSHSLISSAPFDPSLNPKDQLYFNCTLQILYVEWTNERSSRGMVNIYAIDYGGIRCTGPGLSDPASRSWTACPAELLGQVLRIDLFLDAKGMARYWAENTLVVGQIWTFINMRLKKYKYQTTLEASLKEISKARLIEGEALETNVWARDLLMRKAEFERALRA